MRQSEGGHRQTQFNHSQNGHHQTHIKKNFTFRQERAAQARITDLEAQLSRATASSAQLKRSKDEVSWHY